ncbi:hypothetical protein IKG28_00190 [Candidatus Saccharibacteria bacterium]|nr:hypothetical protein [Candidatus Saccharibacteria bacterium]
MPGLSIHLSVANTYINKHKIKDKDAFLLGSVSPDISEDTDITHHSSPNIRNNALSFLLGKVILKDCLNDFDISTDFGKGYFLHLVTDYEFYRSLAEDEEKYRNMSYREIKDILYHDYFATSKYYKEKYNLVFPEIVKEYDTLGDETPLIIDIKKTDSIIEWLGSLNLSEYLNNL